MLGADAPDHSACGRTTTSRTGPRQLFAWYSVGSDRLYGRIEPKKGARPTLRALKAIRARVPDGQMIYVILDNLNHHRGPDDP